MKTLLLATGLLGVLGLAAPAPADAHFSVSIGLPGFVVLAPAPCPPAVAYEGPADYYEYEPYDYYAPAPRVFVHHHRRGHHHGWWRHRDDDDDDDDGDD
jgi:hypothetical protein